MRKIWMRTYFFRSSQHHGDGTKFHESWAVREEPFWVSDTEAAKNYSLEKYAQLGGNTFILEFRRI